YPGPNPWARRCQYSRGARATITRSQVRIPSRLSGNGQRLKAIDEGKEVIPPEYRIETYKQQVEGGKPIEERLLVRKKADLGGNHVSQAAAGYGQEGWEVTLRFDTEGAKTFGQITEANVNHRFAIVLDGVIQSAPVIRTAIYGGNAVISG